MRGPALEYLHFITSAIGSNLGDIEIQRRVDVVANRDDITNGEFSQIMENVELVLKCMEV